MDKQTALSREKKRQRAEYRDSQGNIREPGSRAPLQAFGRTTFRGISRDRVSQQEAPKRRAQLDIYPFLEPKKIKNIQRVSDRNELISQAIGFQWRGLNHPLHTQEPRQIRVIRKVTGLKGESYIPPQRIRNQIATQFQLQSINRDVQTQNPILKVSKLSKEPNEFFSLSRAPIQQTQAQTDPQQQKIKKIRLPARIRTEIKYIQRPKQIQQIEVQTNPLRQKIKKVRLPARIRKQIKQVTRQVIVPQYVDRTQYVHWLWGIPVPYVQNEPPKAQKIHQIRQNPFISIQPNQKRDYSISAHPQSQQEYVQTYNQTNQIGVGNLYKAQDQAVQTFQLTRRLEKSVQASQAKKKRPLIIQNQHQISIYQRPIERRGKDSAAQTFMLLQKSEKSVQASQYKAKKPLSIQNQHQISIHQRPIQRRGKDSSAQTFGLLNKREKSVQASIIKKKPPLSIEAQQYISIHQRPIQRERIVYRSQPVFIPIKKQANLRLQKIQGHQQKPFILKNQFGAQTSAQMHEQQQREQNEQSQQFYSIISSEQKQRLQREQTVVQSPYKKQAQFLSGKKPLVVYGNMLIVQNQKHGVSWIGMWNQTHNYFTKNCIWVPKQYLRFIPQIFYDIQRNWNRQDKVIRHFAEGTCAIIADVYKQMLFYSLRMIKWYKGVAYPTKNGFNLPPRLFEQMIDNMHLFD